MANDGLPGNLDGTTPGQSNADPGYCDGPKQETAGAPPTVTCFLQVGKFDERGNRVKYIYGCDLDYVVYYSRLEHPSATEPTETAPPSPSPAPVRWLTGLRALLDGRRDHDLPYESEGVQAQLSPDPAKRTKQRALLLPLGTERAKLQALLSGWARRQSYDSSIATAMQLALDGDGVAEAKETALQTLRDAKTAILNERDLAGRAQYVKFTVVLGVIGMFLLVWAQHNLFKDTGYFWLGAQAGLIGAVLSIAIGIRRRIVALDIGMAGNLSDSALRLLIGAVSGGALVLLFSTGLLPSMNTGQGTLNVIHSIPFALLLGILAGFVEQLVPSLLEAQGQAIQQGPPTPGRQP
ncbi:MAG: hypothetical protein WDN25_03275 [Acetobacteraceae bacterium]